jgi:hypothetical protein
MAVKSKKRIVVGVPCTPEEKKRFQKLAAASYLNLASFIRKLLNEQADASDKRQTA